MLGKRGSKSKKAAKDKEVLEVLPEHTVNKMESVVVSDRLAKKRFWLIVVFALLVLISGGAVYWYAFRSEEPKEATTPSDIDNQIAARQALIDSKDYQVTFADYLILGNAYVTKKDYRAAEDAYKQAESLNKSDFDVKYALATVYRLQERRDESLKYYDQVIDMASQESSGYHVNLATYQAERDAVARGDFELKEVEYQSDLPL